MVFFLPRDGRPCVRYRQVSRPWDVFASMFIQCKLQVNPGLDNNLRPKRYQGPILTHTHIYIYVYIYMNSSYLNCIGIKAWRSNYVHVRYCDVITQPCPYLYGGLVKPAVEVKTSIIARFMGPTWGPSGADRTQVGPLLAPWTLLSGMLAKVN